jgi:peptidoglycan glycosyltransferase
MILAIVAGLAVLALLLWWLRGRGEAAAAPAAHAVAPGPAQAKVPQPLPPAPPVPITAAQLAQATTHPDGSMTLRQGQTDVPLTLDGKLQQDIQGLLDRSHVPYGAVVLMDPRTGAILAMVEHREPGDPVGAIGGLGQPDMPAASVFKVVTSAALLTAGQTPETKACFHGGKHGIDASHLKASASDTQCQTLTEALAHSTNAAFARLALDHLHAGDLAAMAHKLGWGSAQAGDVAMQPSTVDEGTTPLDFARTAPGFAGSTLSPLHGAMLAATVANHGLAMQPRLVQNRAPQPIGQVITPEVADGLAAMMTQTVAVGTGRHAFSVRPKSLQGMAIAGKTGSLSNNDPVTWRHFSWFVGFAPADHPQVAVAAIAVNGLKWRVKGPQLARDALALRFDTERSGPQTGHGTLDVRTAAR